MNFKGSGVALVTPFKKENVYEVNYDKLTELINFHIENQTDSIIICGTTGESATLTEEEKIVHDLYTLEQIGAPEIARALALEGTQHQLFDDIRQNKFEFFTTIGKEIGEERLTYTKKFLQQL